MNRQENFICTILLAGAGAGLVMSVLSLIAYTSMGIEDIRLFGLLVYSPMCVAYLGVCLLLFRRLATQARSAWQLRALIALACFLLTAGVFLWSREAFSDVYYNLRQELFRVEYVDDALQLFVFPLVLLVYAMRSLLRLKRT
jgi:hypothetical protein